MAAPTLSTSPSTRTIIGTYENDGQQDVFQILGKGGSIECGMNAFGVIYNTVNGALVSVAPIIANVIVTSAQLLALATTPATLVATPGPGRFIFPQAFAVQYISGTTPYTVSGSDPNASIYVGWAAALGYEDSLGLFPDTGFVDQSTSQVVLSTCSSGPNFLSAAVNQSLVLNIVDTLTLGNGYFNISIAYSILPAL